MPQAAPSRAPAATSHALQRVDLAAADAVGALRHDRLNVAFFDYNAFASIAFAACALADLWLA